MNREMLEDILSYIDEHICEKINLSELAGYAGYSPFYFSKLFSDAMGMPVTGYVRIRKLQYAAASLLEGKKVLDVALLYAFDSHEGFTRSFTQLFGSTPSTVKKYLTSYVVPRFAVPQTLKGSIDMETVCSLKDNMHQLVFGFLKQSIEEAKEGFCTMIEVTLLPDNQIVLSDNGRGLPLSTDVRVSKEVLDKILAARPITHVEYSQMGDLIQADLQTINSLCESLQIIVTRDGMSYQQDYVRGIAQHGIKIYEAAGENGTRVCLKPDRGIFGETRFHREMIEEWGKSSIQGVPNLMFKVLS